MSRDSAPFTVTVVPSDASWGTVPNIPLTRGTPASYDLPSLYATGYNAATQDVVQTGGTAIPVAPAAPTDGVSITSDGVLTYDGSGSGSNTFGSVQLNIADTVTSNWATRSTAAGVIWAHDFSESDNEIRLFTRMGDVGGTNPNPAGLGNPMTRVASGLGSSMALRCRYMGSTFTSPTPAGLANDIQTVSVADASTFTDPTTVSGGFYRVVIGGIDPGSGYGYCYEYAYVRGRNTSNNTLSIQRRIDSTSMENLNGVSYPYPAAPSYPAGFCIGTEQDGSWNRPFCALPAGQNGKALSDMGARNGAARYVRTWPTTNNNDGHWAFREAYYGHRYYWDTSYNPSAPYVNWTPPQGPFGTRLNAFEGDEFWLQWRMKFSAARLAQLAPRKAFFIQNAAASGAGQLFMLVGPKHFNEQPPPSERIAGVNYGIFANLDCGGGDGRQPAGGQLYANSQYDGPSQGDLRYHLPSQYTMTYNTRNNSNAYAFCFPADTWVTLMIHMKPGRDNAEEFQPNGTSYGNVHRPFYGVSDPTFMTTVELYAALPGATQWQLLTSSSTLIWSYGDEIGWWGGLYYDAPGMNTFWMSPNGNMYAGSGGVQPFTQTCDTFYTQAILSKSQIALPVD